MGFPSKRSRPHDLRAALFDEYRVGQSAFASGAVYGDLQAFWPHYEANYNHVFAELSKSATVIDVGCGPGSLVGWVRSKGFTNVQGVDLSPGDVAHAAMKLGPGVVQLADGLEYLREREQHFDVVIMKALLEHLPKRRLLEMLEAASLALTADGRLIIEVPNMDWLLASHERYMDLTHEVGFTESSLRSLLSLLFSDVSVVGSRLASPTRAQRWFRPLLVRLVHRTLYVLGEGASETLFAHRSLIAIATTPRSEPRD